MFYLHSSTHFISHVTSWCSVHCVVFKESADTSEEQKVILGHRFVRKSKRPGSKSTCDRCGAIIWRMLQPWYRCAGKVYRTLKCYDSNDVLYINRAVMMI